MHERPTIRQLEYLVALAETLNFRRAAELCFVSQPALSAQIQKLEQLLGVRLFERDPRRVLPTAVGIEVADRAREVLARCDDLLHGAQSFDDPLAGTVRLGVIPTVAPYVLPAVLPAIREARPDLKLLIREERTDDLLSGVDGGRLDVALLALEVDLSGFESLTLFEEAFVVAVPRGHELAGRDAITQEDLRGQSVLLLEDGHCLRRSALEICHARGAAELEGFRGSSLNTLVQMVAGGVGITLLPEMAVPVEVRDDAIVVRPFEPPVPVRHIGLAWRRGSPRAKGFRILGELVESRMRPFAD
ncbi:MAG: LysR family transcriptional regulator [Planctomycetes bacterium]|nr:LysR family transcriptional regulator [Planctomycetota bacterium]